LSGMVRV